MNYYLLNFLGHILTGLMLILTGIVSVWGPSKFNFRLVSKGVVPP